MCSTSFSMTQALLHVIVLVEVEIEFELGGGIRKPETLYSVSIVV